MTSIRRQLEVAEAFGVLGDAAIKRFGQLLAVIRFLQQTLFARIAQKADFRQHTRHVGADQHHKRRLLDAPVLLPGYVTRRERKKSALDAADYQKLDRARNILPPAPRSDLGERVGADNEEQLAIRAHFRPHFLDGDRKST